MTTAHIVEHRWADTSWLQTRPVYLEVADALDVAQRMAQLVPARSVTRTGYQTRVRDFGCEVYATFRAGQEAKSGVVVFEAEGEMGAKLAEAAERDGVSLGQEAKDIVSTAVGAWSGDPGALAAWD